MALLKKHRFFKKFSIIVVYTIQKNFIKKINKINKINFGKTQRHHITISFNLFLKVAYFYPIFILSIFVKVIRSQHGKNKKYFDNHNTQ